MSFDFGLRGERASKGYQLSAWRDTTWETQTSETGFQLGVLQDKSGARTRVAGYLRDTQGPGKKTVLGFFCNDPRRWLNLNVDLTVRNAADSLSHHHILANLWSSYCCRKKID